jgi:hypothetical protein
LRFVSNLRLPPPPPSLSRRFSRRKSALSLKRRSRTIWSNRENFRAIWNKTETDRGSDVWFRVRFDLAQRYKGGMRDRFNRRVVVVLVASLASACAWHPPTEPTRATPPTYVIIGDSIGLGPQWPIVEAALPSDDQWINAAVGSTTFHTQWQPDGSAYSLMRAEVSTPPVAFLAHLGANDTVLQPAPTEASVFADITTLATALQVTYPGALLYLSDVGQVWTYGDKRAENAEVRAAIERAWRELPNVRQGPMLRDLTPDDGVHFTSASNVDVLAARWVAVLHAAAR